MYIYQTPPQDFFQGMQTAKQMTKEFSFNIDELVRFSMKCAYSVAKKTGSMWEGDINELRFIGLPDPDNCAVKLCLIWKQDNNGMTFLCSPMEIPHLESYLL